MTKLITTLLLLTFLFGIAVYVFLGNGGIVQDLQNGHSRITTNTRGFDYSTN